jgi:hypothetical protein
MAVTSWRSHRKENVNAKTPRRQGKKEEGERGEKTDIARGFFPSPLPSYLGVLAAWRSFLFASDQHDQST